jgi:hypothetical protein
VPDDEDVGNAGNGVPTPLLGSTLLAESSEQTYEVSSDLAYSSALRDE